VAPKAAKTQRSVGRDADEQIESAVDSSGPLSRVSPRGWQPILAGAERDAASTVVAEIADALARLPHDGPSLAAASAGRALLHARLTGGDAEQREAALACLRDALPLLRGRGAPSSLHVGAAGIGWVLAHLAGDLLDDRDRCAGLDRALLRLLDRRPWPGHIDLMRGLVGIGVYALERLDAPAGPALLERVVARLDELSVHDDRGTYWWTPPELLPDQVRERSPRGHVDLGVAHGVPGAIAILGTACAADVAADIARPLLHGAVGWLLGGGTPDECFPAWVRAEHEAEPARTAWCYGEPGVAAVLLVAARAVDQPTWEDAALGFARRAALRSVSDSGVVDAGLCHGAAGLGLVFARLHHATGEQVLHDAARFWFGHALDLRAPGTGVAGYTADGLNGPTDEPGLLTGAAGIALALHAAATDREPTWDRILLLSTVVSDGAT
jgi:lantibiotic biosynthesis protein